MRQCVRKLLQCDFVGRKKKVRLMSSWWLNEHNWIVRKTWDVGQNVLHSQLHNCTIKHCPGMVINERLTRLEGVSNAFNTVDSLNTHTLQRNGRTATSIPWTGRLEVYHAVASMMNNKRRFHKVVLLFQPVLSTAGFISELSLQFSNCARNFIETKQWHFWTELLQSVSNLPFHVHSK